MSADLLAAAGDQLPEDVGKSGPLGLLLTVLLLIAVIVPGPVDEQAPQAGPAELRSRPTGSRRSPTTPPSSSSARPGEDLLDTLRKAPRALEPPRRPDDDRPDRPDAGLIRPVAAEARHQRWATSTTTRTPFVGARDPGQRRRRGRAVAPGRPRPTLVTPSKDPAPRPAGTCGTRRRGASSLDDG